MQALRREFLTGAALTEDEHGAVYGGESGQMIQGLGKGQGFAEHIVGLRTHG